MIKPASLPKVPVQYPLHKPSIDRSAQAQFKPDKSPEFNPPPKTSLPPQNDRKFGTLPGNDTSQKPKPHPTPQPDAARDAHSQESTPAPAPQPETGDPLREFYQLMAQSYRAGLSTVSPPAAYLPPDSAPAPQTPVQSPAGEDKILVNRIVEMLGSPVQNWAVITNDSLDGVGEDLGIFHGHPVDIAAMFHDESIHGITLARASNQQQPGTPVSPRKPSPGTTVKLDFYPYEQIDMADQLLTHALPRENLAPAVKAWLNSEVSRQPLADVKIDPGHSGMEMVFA